MLLSVCVHGGNWSWSQFILGGSDVTNTPLCMTIKPLGGFDHVYSEEEVLDGPRCARPRAQFWK